MIKFFHFHVSNGRCLLYSPGIISRERTWSVFFFKTGVGLPHTASSGTAMFVIQINFFVFVQWFRRFCFFFFSSIHFYLLPNNNKWKKNYIYTNKTRSMRQFFWSAHHAKIKTIARSPFRNGK